MTEAIIINSPQQTQAGFTDNLYSFTFNHDKRTCHKNDELTYNQTCAVGELQLRYSIDAIALSDDWFESLVKDDFLNTKIFPIRDESTNKPKFPLEYYKLLYEYKGEYLNDATFYKYYGVHPCEFTNPEELDHNIPTPCNTRAEDNLILDHLKRPVELENHMHNYDI